MSASYSMLSYPSALSVSTRALIALTNALRRSRNRRGGRWRRLPVNRQALQHPNQAEQDRREEHIRSTLRRAACVIEKRDSGPDAEKPSPSAPEGLKVIDVDVIGRPAAASTASELPWLAAVTAAIGRREVPDGVRFAIEVEFRLPSSREHNDRWDLDGLLPRRSRRWAERSGGGGDRGDRRPTTSESTGSSRRSVRQLGMRSRERGCASCCSQVRDTSRDTKSWLRGVRATAGGRQGEPSSQVEAS
ncbi:hypothetical protein HX744_00855 [Pseudonocardia sp. ICBG1122]|nr:hypothetical protein [Pseudonocardia pini]